MPGKSQLMSGKSQLSVWEILTNENVWENRIGQLYQVDYFRHLEKTNSASQMYVSVNLDYRSTQNIGQFRIGQFRRMATLFETDFIILVTEGQNNSILALDELAKNDTFQNDLERITEPAVQSLEGEIEA